jgi:RNA recognition motif-containing protein
LYVGNLGRLDGLELEQLLSRFGTVRFAATIGQGGVPRDHRFGVVEMQSEHEARTAIRVLDGFEINGRPVSVRWATPAEQTACGHPAMFGTMNLSGGPPGEERDDDTHA